MTIDVPIAWRIFLVFMFAPVMVKKFGPFAAVRGPRRYSDDGSTRRPRSPVCVVKYYFTTAVPRIPRLFALPPGFEPGHARRCSSSRSVECARLTIPRESDTLRGGEIYTVLLNRV